MGMFFNIKYSFLVDIVNHRSSLCHLGAPCCELCKLVWNLSCAEPGQGIMLQPFLSQALSPLCVTMSGQGNLAEHPVPAARKMSTSS